MKLTPNPNFRPLCKCHGLPRNAYGACVIKKRRTDRAVQRRRYQSIIAGIRFSRVFANTEEVAEVRSRMVEFRTKQKQQSLPKE